MKRRSTADGNHHHHHQHHQHDQHRQQRVAQSVAAATTLAAMIATPLCRPSGRARMVLSQVVVTSMFASTLVGTARRFGAKRAGAAATSVTALALAAEVVGSRTGLPFGRYRYTAALRPQVAGVPVIVPLAWFAMAVPAREVAGRRLVPAAAALTAWDLFLDPQMVGEGYWEWAHRGRYRGIPLSNYVGWIATSTAVMAVLNATLGTRDPDVVDSDRPAPDQVATYGVMAVMETLGFAAFFRDRLVATVGGVAMLPFAANGVWQLRGRR